MKRTIIKYVIVIILTGLLFKLGVQAAYIERGYTAYGGEYCILLLPVIFWTIDKELADTRKRKQARRQYCELCHKEREKFCEYCQANGQK